MICLWERSDKTNCRSFVAHLYKTVLPIRLARRPMTLPRHDFLPFGLITRPEFDCWQIRRRLELDRSAAAHAAAHMFHDVRRSAVPTVQREPAP